MDHRLNIEADLERLSAEAWLTKLDEVGEELGYFEPLGEDHFALFLDAGPKLFVTFESVEDARKAPGGETVGMRYTREDGWSHLAILSRGESWFREREIYGFFDRLIDDGFFEDFDHVLFYGAHSCAYAACAYSVAAPGANVLALRPQATLDPAVASWDTRYLDQRRTDFTSRYGYAPDMIDAANHAWIAFDPRQRIDAIHAAMFTRVNVTPLPCTGFGWRLDAIFDQMNILDPLIRDAMDGTLTRRRFAELSRARRENTAYLRSIFKYAIRAEHNQLAANMAAQALDETGDRYFALQLQELRDQGFEPARTVEISAA